MQRTIGTVVVVVLCLSLSGVGRASDGASEINQTCAVNTGCFPGDDPGFPVTIISVSSYVLTSDLIALGSEAIRIQHDWVTIDLRGFTIITGGSDIRGAINDSLSSRRGVTVRNGNIINQGSNATDIMIELDETESCLIENVLVHGGETGIVTGESCVVRNSRLIDQDQTALSLGEGTVYSGNLISRAATTEEPLVEGGRDGGGNLCNGGWCRGLPTPTLRRLWYITKTLHLPTGAPTACDTGFHFGKRRGIPGLQYDTTRGFMTLDSGQDTEPRETAWERTGYNYSFDDLNCENWTSTHYDHLGSTMDGEWPCNLSARVVCVQDLEDSD